MSKHHQHSEHKRKGEHTSPKRRIHHDWRFWVAVVLMLGAMFLYVATQDEAVLPDGQVGPPAPADAE